jgi:hypothetical protein
VNVFNKKLAEAMEYNLWYQSVLIYRMF